MSSDRLRNIQSRLTKRNQLPSLVKATIKNKAQQTTLNCSENITGDMLLYRAQDIPCPSGVESLVGGQARKLRKTWCLH
jgi:hypothetical protein